jgi:hypothetical protein
MPFETGNQESKKADHRRAKLFRDAILVELKKTDDDVERMQLIAAKLVEQAMEGNVQAIREIADRVDGKVPQAVVGDDEHDPLRMVTEIRRTIVYPKNPDAAVSLNQSKEPLA